MYVYMYMCMYMYMYMCMYMYMYISQSIYLSIDLSIYLSVSEALYLSIYLSNYPILSLPILSYLSYLSHISVVSIWIYPSIYLSIDRSIDPSIHWFIDPSIHRWIDGSIDRSIDLSIYGSIDLSIYLSNTFVFTYTYVSFIDSIGCLLLILSSTWLSEFLSNLTFLAISTVSQKLNLWPYGCDESWSNNQKRAETALNRNKKHQSIQYVSWGQGCHKQNPRKTCWNHLQPIFQKV